MSSLPIAPAYVPPDIMKMSLEGAEMNRAQASTLATQFDVAQGKTNFLRNALAGALQDPGSTTADGAKALTLAAKSLNDPQSDRIAAAMAANLPTATGNAEKDRVARDAALRTVNGALMSADTRGGYQVPEGFNVDTGAQTGYGALRNKLTGAISPVQSWVQNQAGPAEQASRVTGPPGPGGVAQTVPAVTAPGVAPGLVGAPTITGALAGGPPPIGGLGAPASPPVVPTPGPGPAPTPGAAGAPTRTADDLVNHIIGHENTIYGMTAQDPNSSAAGAAAMINSTWKQELTKVHPELVTGKTDQQIYAMRIDPQNLQLTKDVVQQYMQTNAQDMMNRGIPASGIRADTLYLAHGFGAAGATALLKAPGYEPASQVLSASAMSANPKLAGMTVSDVLTQAAQNAGGRELMPGGKGAAPTAPSLLPPTAGPTATPTATAAGGVPGAMPVGLPVGADEAMAQSAKDFGIARTAAANYQTAIYPMQAAYNALDSSTPTTGRGSEQLYRASAIIRTMTPSMIANLIPFVMSEPDVAKREEANKYLQGLILKNGRMSVEELNTRESANPTVDISPEAAKTVLGANIAMTRMNQALTKEFITQHPNTQTAPAQYSDWMAQNAPLVDPHAFMTDLSKSDTQKYYQGLSAAKKAAFQASWHLGHDQGLIEGAQ